MFNVCPGCGEYSADKIILPNGAFAACQKCGFRHKFLRLPLFILTGASGAGKTTACLGLAAQVNEFVVMESDILWREEFNQPATDYRNYREMWLRVCKNISQAGKPVVLCGAGIPFSLKHVLSADIFQISIIWRWSARMRLLLRGYGIVRPGVAPLRMNTSRSTSLANRQRPEYTATHDSAKYFRDYRE